MRLAIKQVKLTRGRPSSNNLPMLILNAAVCMSKQHCVAFRCCCVNTKQIVGEFGDIQHICHPNNNFLTITSSSCDLNLTTSNGRCCVTISKTYWLWGHILFIVIKHINLKGHVSTGTRVYNPLITL